MRFTATPANSQPRSWPGFDAVDGRKAQDIGSRQLAAMYLICVDTKTKAVHPCDLREIGVQHHVENAFVGGALPDALLKPSAK